MALGDYNNGDNNRRKYPEPTVYCPYRASNQESINPTSLSYQFFNGMLKIIITPMKKNAKPTDNPSQIWDHANEVAVWVVPFKAKIFCDEIKALLADDTLNNVGIMIGTEVLLGFSNGKEFGLPFYCLSIRKIDQKTGEVLLSYVYQFRDNYSQYTSVRNYDPSHPIDFTSYQYKMLEIDTLLMILEEYTRAMTGAYAYALMNNQKYDNNRLNTKIELIMDKLGIESSPEYSRSRSQNRSFFNTHSNDDNQLSMNAPTGMQNTSLDELGDSLED